MRISLALLFPVLSLISLPCAALKADREQNIRIQADAAVVDDKQGLSTYTGNVTVDQGTLHITADKVQIHRDRNEVVKVVASTADKSDRLAHYQQLPDENEALVEADAKEITWFVKEERLHLEGNARFRQTADTSFAGETIQYDARKGIVDARSAGDDDRVETTFKPKRP